MSSGFELAPRRYRLQFADPALAGFEVLVRSATVGEFMEITGFGEDGALSGATLPDDAKLSPSLLAAVAARIDEWNLTRGGEPVKPTLGEVRGLELSVARALVKAWLEAVSGVSLPLGRPSGDGATSPDPSTGELADASVSLPG